MNIEDVSHQCDILSNGLENGFSGKLWSCTACKDKNGLMKGFTMKFNFSNVKYHKMKPSCTLFRGELLPESKKHWGKNMDYQRSNYGKKDEFVYGRPTDMRPVREKKSSVPPSSPARQKKSSVPPSSSVRQVSPTPPSSQCVTCKTTKHICVDCKMPCCALCKASGELNGHLCKPCKLKRDRDNRYVDL